MMRLSLISVLLLAFAGASVAAPPADTVRTRVAGYRALGAAFKTVNDSLRRGDMQSPAVRQAAAQISRSATEQYKWFPRGSGPQPGVKTAAKADIWTRGAEFRAAQGALTQQAKAFEGALASGDQSSIRLEARKLGATCKTCHDQFRAADD